ncbi:MAG: hypothetical protein KIT84_43105 [Labilithrix sp.]|nr:hypothetical protein [Labilithrix sp.]MCW5817869.1 hypothetical protein [Labilithrix sp.]
MKRLLISAVLVASCGHEAPPPPVAVASDLVVPPLGVKPEAPRPAPDPDAPICTARLVAGAVKKSSFGCYLDQSVEGGGTLRYPCSGDGDAHAVFGALRYEGSVSNGELALEAKTELDYDGDGCRWGTTGTIAGAVPRDVRGKLEWRYVDYVLRGQGCSGACTASASLSVHE